MPMAALTRPQSMKAGLQSRRRRPKGLWFERIMATLAFINLILVTFDLSYVRFRDFYLKLAPEFTQWYGMTFKGIEPERSTVTYLETVDKLEEQVAQTGLQSTAAQALLAELRQQSVEMIDENPFQIADKSGTLERIKNLIRDRVEEDSAKEAFSTFWSRSYFQSNPWSEEIAFFNNEIVPLMETNYFRQIAFDGGPIDYFWKIDIFFILIFGLELLARSFYISRRYTNFTWLDAVLARWYDLLLVIPFSAMRLPFLGLLRIIPVAIRLDKARIINLQPLGNRFNRFLVSQIAIELTEVVVLRIIDQIQNLIRQGDIARWLLATGSGRRYIDLNGVNEVQVLTEKAKTLVIDQVLPLLKPEIDALLDYNFKRALDQTPGYQNFQRLPGVSTLSDQLGQQLISQLSANLYSALKEALEDEKGTELVQQLVYSFGDTLRSEVQADNTVREIESLTVALLEEIKLNYVRQLASEEWEALEEQRYKLYNLSQEGQQSKS